MPEFLRMQADALSAYFMDEAPVDDEGRKMLSTDQINMVAKLRNDADQYEDWEAGYYKGDVSKRIRSAIDIVLKCERLKTEWLNMLDKEKSYIRHGWVLDKRWIFNVSKAWSRPRSDKPVTQSTAQSTVAPTGIPAVFGQFIRPAAQSKDAVDTSRSITTYSEIPREETEKERQDRELMSILINDQLRARKQTLEEPKEPVEEVIDVQPESIESDETEQSETVEVEPVADEPYIDEDGMMHLGRPTSPDAKEKEG